MPVNNRIAEFHDEITAWRRELHRHPELAFEETRTADFVAARLGEMGIEVHRGLAKTGVVGVLRGQGEGGPGDGQRAIGLRADLDALPIKELNDFGHRSTHEGCMHACGHDGHTAMLLGAAKYLAETRNFSGTTYFIFQPAEEMAGGGRVMVQEGLFEQFPLDAVFGLHNLPGVPLGEIALRAGPAMASSDLFEITVKGRGTHAAFPHLGTDPVPIAAQIVTALQSIASRVTDPLESAVVSVTQISGGDTWNVTPEEVVLRGTTRALKPEIRERIENDVGHIARMVAEAHGASAEVDYRRGYPAVVNEAASTDLAARVAAEVVGETRVATEAPPLMGAEDFAYMLQEKPGCYIWLGNGGVDTAGGCALHNPHYDFNDEAAVIGASYWAKLVETALPRAG